jgi:hypothetical protein
MYEEVEKLSPFLWRKRKMNGPGAYYLHWCQGCGHEHTYPVGGILKAHNWEFNGNPIKPSFAPSMRIFTPAHQRDGVNYPEETRCHYYVTDGEIRFQPDCRHALSGETRPLEPIPEGYGF